MGGIGAQKCLATLLEHSLHTKDGLLLFDEPDLSGRTPLMIACLNGHAHSVRLLLASSHAHCDVASTDKAGNAVLLYAVESGDAAILRLICQHRHAAKRIDEEMLEMAMSAAKRRADAEMTRIIDELRRHKVLSASTSPTSRDEYDFSGSGSDDI